MLMKKKRMRIAPGGTETMMYFRITINMHFHVDNGKNNHVVSISKYNSESQKTNCNSILKYYEQAVLKQNQYTSHTEVLRCSVATQSYSLIMRLIQKIPP
mmetsp:Transcript_13202/g.37155  ORF Transcript_13202/g.37155 Transcript_13202/m.37155 type:complete len:100 (+) Transcript_13202:1517-1816(+)